MQKPEAAGAQVVPVPFNMPHDELDLLFGRINGLVFQGGDFDPFSPAGQQRPYFRTAKYLFDKAVASNRAGDPFAVWGSCLGFQTVYR